jgi:hypothetical protein
MSPGGHIWRQSGAVGAKCACSGTIATDGPVWAAMPEILGRRGRSRARSFDRRRPNATRSPAHKRSRRLG